jgi:hypothetical protein
LSEDLVPRPIRVDSPDASTEHERRALSTGRRSQRAASGLKDAANQAHAEKPVCLASGGALKSRSFLARKDHTTYI